MYLLFWLTQKFELTRGENQNLRIMEGLRGFAVVLVFFVHYVSLAKSSAWLATATKSSLTSTIAQALYNIGHTGVDLFFVLSGYLIYGSVIKRAQPFPQFMKRRIERIYPTFTVVFFLYTALSFLFPTESKIPPSWNEGTIYLLQNFFLLPGIFNIPPLNTVTWSLSYEMLFYLIIPLLVTLFTLRTRQVRWRVAFFSIITMIFLMYHLVFDGHERMLLFIAGILLYEVMTYHLIKPLPSWLGSTALCLSFAYALLPVITPSESTLKALVLSIGMFLFCFVCFTQPALWLQNIFYWTPLRWLGNMSYSYYLIHGLALRFCFLITNRLLPNNTSELLFWIFLPLMLLVTFVPSTLLFLLIERPFSLESHKKTVIQPNPVSR
ncbi:MAG: acyltransferase family protein [Trueperaceae bacterium]